MTLQEFLSLIVPLGKLVAGKLVDRVSTEGAPYRAFSHAVCSTHAELASNLKRMDSEQRNAYFALASYQQGFHPKPGTDQKQLRVRTNVKGLKALWFDIDFKGEYPDLKTATAALIAFCKATGMPLPSAIVGSGNGMHVYWAFDREIELDRWQRLSDALKVMAVDVGFAHPEIKPSSVDLACTADACRVLRPFGTHNWKDPANPKPVKLLSASGVQYTYEHLEQVLGAYIGVVRRSVTPNTSALSTQMVNERPKVAGLDELTSNVGGPPAPKRFDEIIKHCLVLKHEADTRGRDATEPLWSATLQVLKFCEDADMWVHPVSDGHPGYRPDVTAAKWQTKVANSSGPTRCDHFSGHSTLCAKCPFNGTITSPVELGFERNTGPVTPASVAADMPLAWRVNDTKSGMERSFFDPASKTVTWNKTLGFVVSDLRSSKNSVGDHSFSFEYSRKGISHGRIEVPGGTLGNTGHLLMLLAGKGCTLAESELKPFKELMTSWLRKLQDARAVNQNVDKLGWVETQTDTGLRLNGFATGNTTFYADGAMLENVAADAEYAQIAKHYMPSGGLDQWKFVAEFLAVQNKGAFTAILSAAFATPLLRFTGINGAILSIVSSASGVGKSSALKCAQAVWGSPTHGVNAVNDTVLSVAKKLGFLNNLPAFWDELRGAKMLEDFLQLAFQVTQGKERTRLDSSARLKMVATWETMLIVASNESIFDAMARQSKGSDAGMMRTFELVVEPFQTDRNKAELAMMFSKLDDNFGHAGRVYAKFLAGHADEVRLRVETVVAKLATTLQMEAQERFWFSIMAVLMVGAEYASRLDLVKIDTRALGKYLMAALMRLRQRSTQQLVMSSPSEIVAAFMTQHRDSAVIVDRFQKRGESKFIADLTGGIPRTDKMKYQVSRTESIMRVAMAEFTNWLEFRQLPVSQTLTKLRTAGMRSFKGLLGAGTNWVSTAQVLLEFDLARLRVDALWNPDDSSDSRVPTAPADSTAQASPP